MSEASNKLWVKCKPCGHVWIAAHLPMEMTKCAKLMKSLHCPSCAAPSKSIFLAEKADIPSEAA